MIQDSRRFWVIMCPGCGQWQSCWVQRPREYTFKCRRCNRSAKLWKERTRGIGLHHKTVCGESKAAEVVQELNNEGNQEAGFYTYKEAPRRSQ